MPIPHISTLSEYQFLLKTSGAAYIWLQIWLKNTPENCELSCSFEWIGDESAEVSELGEEVFDFSSIFSNVCLY